MPELLPFQQRALATLISNNPKPPHILGPEAAIWHGPPTKERIAQIFHDYPIMPNGWIYHQGKRWHRYAPWKQL